MANISTAEGTIVFNPEIKRNPGLWKKIGVWVDYNVGLAEMAHSAVYMTYFKEPWDERELEYSFNGDGRWHMSNTLKLLFRYEHIHKAVSEGRTENEGIEEYREFLKEIQDELHNQKIVDVSYIDYDPGMSYASENQTKIFIDEEAIGSTNPMLCEQTYSKDIPVNYKFLKEYYFDDDILKRDYGLILGELEQNYMDEIGDLESAKEIAHYLADLDGNEDYIRFVEIEEGVIDRQLIYDMKD